MVSFLLPYFCYQCRQELKQIKEAFVLDHYSSKVFCSEPCIVQFHRPYIDYFSNQEKQFRQKIGIEREEVELSDQEQFDYVGQLINSPDQQQIIKDDLGTEFVLLSKIYQHASGKNITALVISHQFKERPSFIFHHLFTSKKELLQCYGLSHKNSKEKLLTSSDSFEEGPIDTLMQQELGQLKQYLWQELLKLQQQGIEIPSFNGSDLEQYKVKTLERPQEVYQFFQRPHLQSIVMINDDHYNQDSIYSFVLCYQAMAAKGQEPSGTWIPLYHFVSNRPELYYFFKQGPCLTRRAVN